MPGRGLRIVAVAAAVVLAASFVVALALPGGGRTVSAYFASGEGVFPDNSVRVLGVPVGRITAVTPDGTRVRVDMEITDDDLTLPADVRAVVVSPSVVTGRYVQFTPTWSGGPELPDGAVIPIERTAVPLGVDDLTRTANDLATALGPRHANADGALSDALTVGARNLDGNGAALNQTVRDLGELSGTLSGSQEELFGTVRELQSFVANIKRNDAQVREFNHRLQDVAGFLADDRENLGDAFRELSIALGDVAAFVRDNRELLDTDVERLVNVTDAVVRQRKALAEILDLAPAALGNYANAHDAVSGTIHTRLNIGGGGPGGLTALLCQLAAPQFPTAPHIGQVCAALTSGSAQALTALRGKPAGAAADQVPGLAVPTDEPGAIPDVTTLPAPAEQAPDAPAQQGPAGDGQGPALPGLLGSGVDPLGGGN